MLSTVIQLIRPSQWLKNLFLFLPLFFNGSVMNWQLLLLCILAFIAFSLTASAVYCFNDICDVGADKLHPEKQHRPIASRKISVLGAYLVLLACLCIALAVVYFGLADQERMRVSALLGGYFVMNVAYCLQLKNYAIIDVMIISVGFVMRIFVGAAATGIWLSQWMVIMTFLLALFLAFAKRRDDVVRFKDTGVMHRTHTNRYNLEFLNQILTSIATITIIAYIMFTLSTEVMARFQDNNLYLTSIFVITGIIRYLQLTIVDAKSGSPTMILMKDGFIQACVLLWMVSFLFLIYL